MFHKKIIIIFLAYVNLEVDLAYNWLISKTCMKLPHNPCQIAGNVNSIIENLNKIKQKLQLIFNVVNYVRIILH